MSSSQRPAKRQRRSTRALSDDEETLSPATLPVRESSQTNGARGTRVPITKLRQATSRPSSARSSPQTSPEKARKSRKPSADEPRNKSINSFFGKATEEQRWHKKPSTPDLLTENLKVKDDIMDDEISDDDLAELVSNGEKSAGSNATKVMQRPSNGISSFMPPPSSSQRFRKASGPPATSSPLHASANEDERDYKPWADRYGPENLDELAVHKKKVQDVQKWLLDAVTGRSPQRLLVLKGPAGTGKSSTVRALAKLLKLGLVNWQNPNVSEVGPMSATAQFTDFINRGAGYATLGLDYDESNVSSASIEQVILLVEEFPASAMRFGGGMDAFRNVLQNYLAASQSRNTFGARTVPSHAPIILVISETLVSSATALTDSFTAHRLLGPELTHNPGVAVIEFNPVAPTFIAKALELVIRKEARDSSRRRIPGPVVLQKLAEVGDIRSAVNSLEFLCSRNDDTVGWSGTVAASSKRSSKSSQPLSEMEENSIKLISQRESTLDMFHAAGKVVYNKREDPQISKSGANPPPNPPSHMAPFHRPKVSQVDIESLLNETGTDIQTFISTLHENYVLSCNHDDFVDYLEACSAYLSDSELLNPDTRRLARGRGAARTVQVNIQSDTTDALRQDEIGFQLATRGLLFSLPFPVSRATAAGARKADSFKMYYPTGLRIWKPTEEIRDLVELQAKRLLEGSIDGLKGTKPTGGIESWNSRMFDRALAADDEDSGENATRIDTNKDNLVLEILPYLTQIRHARQEDVSLLNKIIKPRGLHVSGEEPFAEETEEIGGIGSSLRQKVEAAHSTLRTRQGSGGDSASPRKNRVSLQKNHSSKEEPAIQTLYIEDDDIMDD